MAKRKKKVFTNDMVAHVYAHQSQQEGRSKNGSFWFEGKTLYHWQTPIANVVPAKNKKTAFLVTTENYSVTTQRRLSELWSAFSAEQRGTNVFYVPFLGVSSRGYYRNGSTDLKANHKANIEYLIKQYDEIAGKVLRSVSYYSSPLAQLQADFDYVTRYADYFGVKIPKLKRDKFPFFNVDKDVEIILAKRADRERRNNDPAIIAKRERDKMSRAALKERKELFERAYREGMDLRDNGLWFDNKPFCSLRDYYEAERDYSNMLFTLDGKYYCNKDDIYIAERDDASLLFCAGKVYCTERDYTDAERDNRIYLWRDGASIATYMLPRGVLYDGESAILRVKEDQLETCQGASVPLDHAVKAFKAVMACKEQGIGWKKNGHTIHVGHFQLDEIFPNGDLKAGCHFIKWPEIERIARQLNLYP